MRKKLSNYLVVTKEKRNFAAKLQQCIQIGVTAMLGINAPKVLAKGEYAQAVRKAALASQRTKGNNKGVQKTKSYPYKFEWVL